MCRSLKSSSLKGNEKADDPTKEEATLDGGSCVAKVRAITVQREREEVCCDLWGHKKNFTDSNTLVSRPTVTRVTFDLPRCKELL